MTHILALVSKTIISFIRVWEEDRNERCLGVDWQFTTADARIKFRHLYPATQSR